MTPMRLTDAARDDAMTRRALQMAADEIKKVCPVWPPDGPPDMAAAMVNDYLHSAHDAILALQPPATRWQEVPEGYKVVPPELTPEMRRAVWFSQGKSAGGTDADADKLANKYCSNKGQKEVDEAAYRAMIDKA